VWKPWDGKGVPHDFSGLAFWLNRADPIYAREFLAAKKEALAWEPIKDPLRPYLAREKAALEWLAMLDALSAAEQGRLSDLRASKFADAVYESVEITDLLEEYRDNEVRADTRFKGQVVELRGVVGNVKRDVTATIYVTLGTGKPVETPEVQCFFEDRLAKRAAELSRGDKISVVGRVRGLLVNVLMDCEFAG